MGWGVEMIVGTGVDLAEVPRIRAAIELFALDGLIESVRQAAEVGADQAGDGFGAFDEASELDVMPAFAVRHGGIGDALKEVCAILHGAEEAVRIGQAGVAGDRKSVV